MGDGVRNCLHGTFSIDVTRRIKDAEGQLFVLLTYIVSDRIQEAHF